MFLKIDHLSPKKFIGRVVQMSLVDDKTPELWRGFMPHRRTITNAIGTDLYCIQVYPDQYSFENFDPSARFNKWAVVEVNDFSSMPAGMTALEIPGGQYAVFLHKGAAATGANTFRYIFETWLPSSGYKLDQRPHFELLGNKYINNDPVSEEEIWIPVRE